MSETKATTGEAILAILFILLSFGWAIARFILLGTGVLFWLGFLGGYFGWIK
jgi:hypothetical protein